MGAGDAPSRARPPLRVRRGDGPRYLTKNVKYVANYERTTFEGGRTGGDRETENALLFRAQVGF
jgi:hypothetical protein